MNVKGKNEALTVFSDISVLELKKLLEINSFPVIVMKNSKTMMGISDENLFWKQVNNGGYDQKLEYYLNRSFCMVQSIEDLKEDDLKHYEYVIQNSDQHYRCYTNFEIKEMKLQRKIKRLLKLNESLHEELEVSRKKNKELTQILHSTYDEIFVTDAKGKTLFVSESCKKLTGLPPEAFINKNVEELVEKGLIVNSVTIKTMKTKTIHSAEQTYPNGVTVFSTSKPLFDEEGNLYRIISNSRDISELVEMKNKLKKVNSEFRFKNSQYKTKKITFFNKLITESDNMISVIDLAEKVAPMDSSIFIHGESGVGKGVVAKIVHELSPRKNNSFIQVNCGAIPPTLIESELFGYEAGAFTGANKRGKAGLVEMADGGTLFLDEIGELPLDLQVKLLQLVQEKTFKKIGSTKERQVNIRIISATNKNLKQMIEEKTFREDLYYRLHVVPLRIPSLRERKKDILLLIEHFLQKFNEKYRQAVSLDESSKLVLQLHEYPGNVRELENLMEQIVVTARNSVVSMKDLPFHFSKKEPLKHVKVTGIIPIKKAVEETEKQILSYALSKYKTTRKIAKVLEVNQTTIMRKLHKYQLACSEDE